MSSPESANVHLEICRKPSPEQLRMCTHRSSGARPFRSTSARVICPREAVGHSDPSQGGRVSKDTC
eukprot:7252547-Alexandrium_andersonii.AAC.1